MIVAYRPLAHLVIMQAYLEQVSKPQVLSDRVDLERSPAAPRKSVGAGCPFSTPSWAIR